ncbi:TetR/AcrR family transcriptional regulator [Sphingobium chlorophenolicum]|uniref:TetR family transcriptional regulator n=1 Tax=Sphingobium chlorophenolicum TaxID=46429 RepID=A0A081RFE4_SPHCR|nr:TetR/AcrR family transcriptional regulator [Sphingobium chlorophenolicum]KEQ53917.1 TetR family transcriptional regulator [Sphingobium chlorophenolicum]
MPRKKGAVGEGQGEQAVKKARPAEKDTGKTSRKRGAQVRKEMLNAAAHLFAKHGFAGTNLRDLADVLGITRPGVYYHFPNKEKILEALIEEVTLSSVGQSAEIAEQVDRDPEDALRLVMRSATKWVLENPVMFRVLDRSEADMPAELKERHNVSKKAILENFTHIIQRGIAIGKFRTVDPHVAALTIIGMRNWAAWWFNPNGRIPMEEVADTIADMAVRSLLRPDAHRSRSDRVEDILRILKEDVAHLEHVIKG